MKIKCLKNWNNSQNNKKRNNKNLRSYSSRNKLLKDYLKSLKLMVCLISHKRWWVLIFCCRWIILCICEPWLSREGVTRTRRHFKNILASEKYKLKSKLVEGNSRSCIFTIRLDSKRISKLNWRYSLLRLKPWSFIIPLGKKPQSFNWFW